MQDLPYPGRPGSPIRGAAAALALALAVSPVAAQEGPPDPPSRAAPDLRPHGGDPGLPFARGSHALVSPPEDWDVTDPPFPREEVAIEASEGTWMNVDVSPDGAEIAFDLLGDLYVLPAEGGEARPLIEDFAWNMQPRYSPDGEWIAFTSDRSGGDNIWVMDREGENLHQVTDEDFRLLNGPAWTPDSQYIVARKHFTGTRSLGSGEMWMYHRSGGSGVQLTERPNDQTDVNEPVFSPDGRYLYYSKDVTPGDQFQYAQDSNQGIYAIRRLDLETGDEKTVVSGPGGAVRPMPSPDGEYLAYVRRVRFQTTLFVRHLESGREWPVYDDLERDNQEIWAIHGVYPTIAWTPDSEELVFWARGRIHRLDVEAETAEEVPFRVETTREVAEPVRPANEAHPDEVDVRMLRWVEVAPEGDRVVYSAMGHLYVRDLPDGEPRRLTDQDDHFEYYPTFSRDGEEIAYVSWDDEELATVRVAPSGGGEGRVVTQEPGHYVEPAFSPDGETIVFRRTGGGGVVSPHWSEDTGLYRVPTAGGPAEKIVPHGQEPHFGADPERVYFRAFEEGMRALRSVELSGARERTHVRSQWAARFRVSPDGEHVAWEERYQAYVRPLPRAGGPVDVGPGSQDLPQQRVSRDAGDFLHWSGDGAALHWSTGPELFTLEVADAFPDAGEEAAVDLPLDEGLHIGFQVPSHRPEGVVALEGGRVVTMDGDEVIEDGTVVVEGNRIVDVGPSAEVEVPAEAHRKDVSGRTVLPGLIDAHWHGPYASGSVIPQRNRALYASLAFGVTTTHNPSAATHEVFTASEMMRTGRVVAPRLFSTGRILYGATTGFTAEVDELDDAFEHLRRLGAAGAFSVKSYNQPRRDQRQQVLQAAREEGIRVYPEGGALFMHNMTMVKDGHTSIEHSLPVEAVYDDVLQLWGSTEVAYTPTLVVAFGGIWGEDWFYQHDDVWENDRVQAFNPPLRVEARSRRRQKAPEEEYNHIRTAEHTRDLAEAGVPVALGAHGQLNGLDAHWELRSFVQGGMTPHEALRVGTMNGARFLGMEDDLGSIEPGKLADLIVVEGDPLADIEDAERVRHTMVNGRIFDAETMDEVGNHPRERGPFFWEDWGWR